MALDQPRPAPGSAYTPDRLPALVVDPDALSSAARILDDLPGPQRPNLAPPSAEAVGHPALARDISAFHERYRAAAFALATDHETTSAHLAGSAAAYDRAESDATARLTELRAAPPPTSPGSTDSNNTDQISDDQNTGLREA
jgi:hypothetical protein